MVLFVFMAGMRGGAPLRFQPLPQPQVPGVPLSLLRRGDGRDQAPFLRLGLRDVSTAGTLALLRGQHHHARLKHWLRRQDCSSARP